MPNLTEKHYAAIAAEVRRAQQANSTPAHRIAVADVAIGLASYFESDDPRFDRARFLAACGIEELTAAPAVDSACL